jgi:hypothetical protein
MRARRAPLRVAFAVRAPGQGDVLQDRAWRATVQDPEERRGVYGLGRNGRHLSELLRRVHERLLRGDQHHHDDDAAELVR